jgi:hypothetical protein
MTNNSQTPTMDNPQPANLVLKKILEVIPPSETEVMAALTKFKENEFWNKAPELMTKGDIWIPLTRLLNSTMGEIDTEWKKKAVEIFCAGKRGELNLENE